MSYIVLVFDYADPMIFRRAVKLLETLSTDDSMKLGGVSSIAPDWIAHETFFESHGSSETSKDGRSPQVCLVSITAL